MVLTEDWTFNVSKYVWKQAQMFFSDLYQTKVLEKVIIVRHQLEYFLSRYMWLTGLKVYGIHKMWQNLAYQEIEIFLTLYGPIYKI